MFFCSLHFQRNPHVLYERLRRNSSIDVGRRTEAAVLDVANVTVYLHCFDEQNNPPAIPFSQSQGCFHLSDFFFSFFFHCQRIVSAKTNDSNRGQSRPKATNRCNDVCTRFFVFPHRNSITRQSVLVCNVPCKSFHAKRELPRERGSNQGRVVSGAISRQRGEADVSPRPLATMTETSGVYGGP